MTNRPLRGGKAKRSASLRNSVARSPLLRKGGPHETSTGGKRHRGRLLTHEAIEEWLELEETWEERETGSHGSPFLHLPGNSRRKSAAVLRMNLQRLIE